MDKIVTYRDLILWQKGVDLVEAIYRLTAGFPRQERFGLTSQIQRAAVSVPANVAEGFGRGSRKDYLRYLAIARGSMMEVETQLTIAVRLKMIPREQATPVWDLIQEVGRLLHGLMRSLKAAKQGEKASSGQAPRPAPEVRTDR